MKKVASTPSSGPSSPTPGLAAWPKLAVACHTGSHLLAGAVFGRGPSQDSPHLPAAVRPAARHLRVGPVLGDAGYDAEHHHARCRDRLGIPVSVFRLNPRSTGRAWPRTPYNPRWQVGSAFSRHKRRLGPFLRSRSRPAQKVESQLRVLTHNLMLLAAWPPFRSTEH